MFINEGTDALQAHEDLISAKKKFPLHVHEILWMKSINGYSRFLQELAEVHPSTRG